MPFLIRLIRIVTWSSWIRRLDVTDVSDESLINGDGVLAPWKRAAIARFRV